MTTTWNASDKDAAITLSNTNHTASTTGGDAGVRGTTSHASGKWYLEYTAITNGGLRDIRGFASATQALNTNTMTTGFGCNDAGSMTVNGGSAAGSPAGHTLQMAIDIDAGKVWLRLDGGTWNGNGGASPDPATGASGSDYTSLVAAHIALFPFCVMLDFGAVPTTTLNAGDSAFANAPPSGFTAWDSTPPITRSYGAVIS